MKPNHRPIPHTISIHDVYQSRDPDFLQKFSNSIQSISGAINRTDSFGRTLLHRIASSNLESDSIGWLEILSKNPHLQINLPDLESGWTPLHRALYHGNLRFAKALIENFECDLGIKDHEGLSAFDLYMRTIGGPISFYLVNQYQPETYNSDLFTWGSNRNFLLGFHDDGDRQYPERIHLRSFDEPHNWDNPFISSGVKFVAMSKLHTALITSEGELRVCGFGSGGRLGLTSVSKSNTNHDNLNSILTEAQFTFAPVKGGGLANQRVNYVALGQDHTVVVTESGQVFTFGMNRFGQLGYAPESTGTSLESMVQVEPKRVAGLLKKVHILGAAASRWHTAVFSSDSLYTWGANRGQLGYSHSQPLNSSCPIQLTPRKVSIAHTSIIQLTCMSHETAYLCENSSEVYILKSDITIRVVFPFERFPSNIQVSVLPAPTRIVHINGSDQTLGVVSSMGDVYIVDLEQASSIKNSSNHISMSCSPHRSNVPSISSGPVFKPQRVWTSTNWIDAAKCVTVGMDGNLIVVTMSGDVHISYKRSGGVSKGMEIRSSEPSPSNAVRKNYKFQKIPYLQRVSQVAASPTGSYAAIRQDILLDNVRNTLPEEKITLPAMLASMLPHLKKQASLVPELHTVPSPKPSPKLLPKPFYQPEDIADADDDFHIAEEEQEQADLKWDVRVGSALVGLSMQWIDHCLSIDQRLSGSLEDGDIFLVARSGEHILAHRFVLCSRSKILDQIINGLLSVDGISFHSDQAGDTTENQSSLDLPTLWFSQHSLLTLLLLIHYLYTDDFPCLWDLEVWSQIEMTYNKFLSPTPKVGDTQDSFSVVIDKTKDGLKALANSLSLPALQQCLERHGKSTPKPSLSHQFRAMLPGLGLDCNLLEKFAYNGNQNLPHNPEDRFQFDKSRNLDPDIELEMKDGEVLKCHSILMRAQCPFFHLIYDEGIWVKARRQPIESSCDKSLIRFDMGHLTKEAMQVVLLHIYTDDADNLFFPRDFHSLNEYVDFVFDVMAVANELMMDKLKFICSVILRPCVNLLNVTAIAAEAEFYRADSLKEICMDYMIHNLEGIFQDRKVLANIPDDLLSSLSNHLKKIQETLSPISRSHPIIEELMRLMRRHAKFLIELDLPTPRSKLGPTSHRWKSPAKLSAPSQAPIDVNLCSTTPADQNSTRGFTENSNEQWDSTSFAHSTVPDSSAVINGVDSRPHALGYEMADDATTFVIDDVDAAVTTTMKAFEKTKLNSSSICDRSAWATPVNKVTPLDIRATMSTEKQRCFPGPLSLDSRLPSDYSTFTQKLSQREKRRQSAQVSKSKLESTLSSSQNYQTKQPAWRSVSGSDRKIASGEIDSTQALIPPLRKACLSSSPNSTPIQGPSKRDNAQVQAAAAVASSSRASFAKHSPESNDPASAVGAAIITPTRKSNKETATRQFSHRNLGGQDTPWTNYASSCSNFLCPASLYSNLPDATPDVIVGPASEASDQLGLTTFTKPVPSRNSAQVTTTVDGIEMGNESTTKPTNFSIIQEIQAKERWALYGPGRKVNRPSLTQIQEEENRKASEKKQEEQFLKWFEEESQRVQKQQEQQEQDAKELRKLNSRLRSTKPVNKKSTIYPPAAHRDKRGNSSKSPKDKRTDPRHLNEHHKTADNYPQSNKRPAKNRSTADTATSASRQQTTEPQNKKKSLTSSGAEIGVKSSKPQKIAPNNTFSIAENTSEPSKCGSPHPDHRYPQHHTLSGVYA